MDFSLLTDCPLFRGLISTEIEEILNSIPYKTQKFNSGSLIAQSGELVQSFRIVFNGIVKGEMVDYSGKVIKIEDIPAPGAIAPAFIFGCSCCF
jgi:hypothetical protein